MMVVVLYNLTDASFCGFLEFLNTVFFKRNRSNYKNRKHLHLIVKTVFPLIYDI